MTGGWTEWHFKWRMKLNNTGINPGVTECFLVPLDPCLQPSLDSPFLHVLLFRPAMCHLPTSVSPNFVSCSTFSPDPHLQSPEFHSSHRHVIPFPSSPKPRLKHAFFTCSLQDHLLMLLLMVPWVFPVLLLPACIFLLPLPANLLISSACKPVFHH